MPGVNRAVGAARSTRATFGREFRVVWPDGSIHWILGGGEFLYDAPGNAMRMCGAVLGIDDANAQKRPYAGRRTIRNALDNMLEGCTLIDSSWRYLYLNETAAAHGLGPGRPGGPVNAGGVSGNRAYRAFRALPALVLERAAQQFEKAVTFPDGSTRWFEVSVVPVPEGIFVLSLEVTDEGRRKRNCKGAKKTTPGRARFRHRHIRPRSRLRHRILVPRAVRDLWHGPADARDRGRVPGTGTPGRSRPNCGCRPPGS